MKTIDLARYQKSRESLIEAGRFHFTVRRPTELDITRVVVASGGSMTFEDAVRYIVGWDVLESDLLPGGEPVPVVFDAKVFADWIADQPNLWEPVISGVVTSYRQHQEAIEARGNG